MSRKRRTRSPDFKAKVALAAIKGDETLSELARQYQINANLIVKWKKLMQDRIFVQIPGLKDILRPKFYMAYPCL